MLLRDYLEEHEMGWVVRLREQIRGLDLSRLIAEYSSRGPAPIHPSIMLGLILYGMILRQWSLRELESLALRDLGAWFICGGEQPDHSTIGDFVLLHASTFNDPVWFAAQTKILIRGLNISGEVVAGDGTVLESLASRFRTLNAEAAKRKAEKAARDLEASPDDPTLQQKAVQSASTAAAAVERAEARADKGRNDEGNVIAPTDPEAVPQPLKNGGPVRPAYKGSAMATASRIIVGCHVDATSETAAVRPMLEQHRAIFGEYPRTALFDAGYHCIAILALAIELELDVLTPSGKATGDDDWEKDSQKKKFPKRLFVYQQAQDAYECPAGRPVVFLNREHDRYGREVRVYRGAECAGCQLRAQCTDAVKGRGIKRYEGDELKEAMAETMRQPAARQRYRQRSSIVEPIFSALQNQGLKRFRRRGVRGAGLELSLHALAHNARRTLRLRALACALLIAVRRPHGGPPRAVHLVVVVVCEVTPMS